MERTSFGIIILLMASMGISIAVAVEAKEISFTQEDREGIRRLEAGQIRLEERLKALDQRIDDVGQRFDDVNQRIDDVNQRIGDVRGEIKDLRTFMLWGFGILFGGMGMLIGFVIWDRRTALSPVVRKAKELEEKEEFLEKVLREYAKVEPKLAKILKSLSLM